MAPKSRGPGVDRQKDIQATENPLQAVVLADSFETRFQPFTSQKPRCLLPLAGYPLIEYTLDFLARAGVKQVFLYCAAHVEAVEDYIAESKWRHPSAPFELVLLRSNARSVGDAMRDLDQRELLKDDFIVVHGDVVSNLDLSAALTEHRRRRAADKDVIMTMILRNASNSHHTAASTSRSLFVIDSLSQQCLQYEQIRRDNDTRSVDIFKDLLTSQAEIELRHDLLDCGVDICSPDALLLWSDNFDYEAPRRGFLHGVLKDSELHGKKIYTYLVDDAYVARVRNLRAYRAVTQDILNGWGFSSLPNETGSRLRLQFPHGPYLEDGVRLERTCKIGRRNLVRGGTCVGSHSYIQNSIVGRDCTVGANCVIERSYIWDGATIGDGTRIQDTIIGENVSIGKDCAIDSGSLVSSGVSIPPNSVLGAERRVATSNDPIDASDRDDVDSSAGLLLSRHRRPSAVMSISSFDADSDVSESGVFGNDDDSINGDIDAASSRENEFVLQASTSIYESLQSGNDVSTIHLELQGLRMASNASEHQIRKAVVQGLVRYAADERSAGRSTKTIFRKNQMLIERTIFDKDQTEKPDQVDLLLLAQTELSSKDGGDDILMSLCNELYMMDVVEQEGLEQWWQDDRGTASQSLRDVRVKTTRFMQVLAEADEEDDDDDDDDDEDEDDDDD